MRLPTADYELFAPTNTLRRRIRIYPQTIHIRLQIGDRDLTAAPSTRSLELPGSAATPADLTQSDLRRRGDLPEAGPVHSDMPSRRSLSWVNETAKSSCLRRGMVI